MKKLGFAALATVAAGFTVSAAHAAVQNGEYTLPTERHQVLVLNYGHIFGEKNILQDITSQNEQFAAKERKYGPPPPRQPKPRKRR